MLSFNKISYKDYLEQNNIIIKNEIKSSNDIIKYFTPYLVYSYYALFYYFINLNRENSDKTKYGNLLEPSTKSKLEGVPALLEHVGNIKFGYIIYSDLLHDMFPYLLNEELSKINKKRYNDFGFDGIDIINKNIYQVKNY